MAQRRLGNATASANNLYEQLSSGMRINKASDDAAGLAIANDLNVKNKVYSQGILNGNDGQSLLSIAESTVSNLTEIVTRIRELSTQAANGALSNSQRESLDAEAQALAKEYFRVSRSAKFNGLNLFDGSMSDGLRLQLGFGTDGSLQSSLGGALGNGTFGAGTTYSTEPTQTNQTALGDLNGDGILDLVTAGSQPGPDGYTTVRLGLGDGTFGAATSYMTTDYGTTSIELADLNNDGVLDIVTGNSTTGDTWVGVRLGAGDGTFGSNATYATGTNGAADVAVADLNGDGIQDILSGGGGGAAYIRFGNGNGTFGAATTYSTETTAVITAADLNQDGILDLVTAGAAVGGVVTVRMGVGNGQFSASTTTYATEFSGSGQSNDMQLQDLNKDGILDIVTGGIAGRVGYMTVRLGVGDGTFGAATSYNNGGSSTSSMRLADINGDGNLDAIFTITNGVSTSNVLTRLGNGNGTFGAARTIVTGNTSSTSLAVGDLNGDGVIDFIASGANTGVGTTSVHLSGTRDGISPILPFSLATKADAMQSMGMLDRNLANLSKQRGVIGAYQSRLNVAINHLKSSADNFKAAESRIKDIDVAQATADLVRTQILQKASVAVLAQANQEPGLALRLLT
jgi:flagellin-like hook-associated protein FlgL